MEKLGQFCTVGFYLGYNIDYKTKFQTVFINVLQAIFITKVVVLCSFEVIFVEKL